MSRFNKSLRLRLIAHFLLIAMLGITVAVTVSSFRSSSLFQAAIFEQLRGVADQKAQQLRGWVNEKKADFESYKQLIELLQLSFVDHSTNEADRTTTALRTFFRQQQEFMSSQFNEIFFMERRGGRVSFSTNPAAIDTWRANSTLFSEGLKDTYITGVYPASNTLNPTLSIALPIFGADKAKAVGVLAADLNLIYLESLLHKKDDPGSVYLVDSLNSLVSGPNMNKDRFLRGVHSFGIDEAIHGNNGEGVFLNYEGVEVVGIYRWLPGYDLALLMEIPTAQAFGPALRLSFEILLSGFVTILLASILIYFISQRIIRPILKVKEAAVQVAKGDLTVMAPILSSDEVGELARTFNQMIRELGSLYSGLENRVEVRTRELSRSNEALEKRARELKDTLENLKRTQHMLVQSEKLAALGQLVAGVAHEINNPLGAINSSAGLLIQTLKTDMPRWMEVLRTMTPGQVQLFQLLTEAGNSSFSAGSSKAERELRFHAEDKLTAAGWPHPRQWAERFVALKIAHRTEEFLPYSAPSDLVIFEIVQGFLNAISGMYNIQTAAERAAKIVYALKTYGRYDSSGKSVPVDIPGNIETVITLYENLLKQGVEVERRFQAVPMVPGYPDDLSQVWTNLIHNALHAMKNKGKIIIEVREDSGFVIVSITDTGNGIPPEILDRIFDPFFTTKPPGEGSGLGLDIVRKIVEKHNGRVTVASNPGEGATFNVFLPLKG